MVRYMFLVKFFVLFFSVMCFSQSYEMSAANISLNNNVYEFDVYLKSTGSNFSLSSYQCSFSFNNLIANGGVLTFSYVPGSSEISKIPAHSIRWNKLDSEMELTFASCGEGLEMITTTNKRVGRFRLQNSVSFNSQSINLQWDFNGFSTTILTGVNYDVMTQQSFHLVKVSNTIPQDRILAAAENAKMGNGAALKVKAGSLGNKVAYCPTNKDYIRFTINIPKTGNWYIWGRFFYEGSNKANSFNLKVDGGSPKVFGNQSTYDKWHWDGASAAGINLGTLNAGVHDIVVSGREAGTTVMIDQIFFTMDPTYVPDDQGVKLAKESDREESITAEIPSGYELMQNFPNPFNPSTTIRYALQKNSFITLKVYDILGNEIQTLVNEEVSAGIHEINFNAEHLSSGVYLYVLKADKFTDMKKFILMK